MHVQSLLLCQDVEEVKKWMLPSKGSLGHPEACRRPCIYFLQGNCDSKKQVVTLTPVLCSTFGPDAIDIMKAVILFCYLFFLLLHYGCIGGSSL